MRSKTYTIVDINAVSTISQKVGILRILIEVIPFTIHGSSEDHFFGNAEDDAVDVARGCDHIDSAFDLT
jgi:hypothetical protein